MMDYVPTAYVILAGAAFLITYVAMQISLRRVVARLKQLNMPLWVAMGSPTPTYFTRFRDYTTSRPINVGVPPPTEYSELSMWLAQRGYRHLNEVGITTNADRYMFLRKLQFAICAVAVCAFLYFKFVAHRVAT
jgi:hypothetical protein